MTRFRAAWVLPIDGPPIRDGFVTVSDGRVTGVGAGVGHHFSGADASGAVAGGADQAARDIDLGSVAILPGLVNAHTHLELSHLRGQVPPADSFITWVRGIIRERRRPETSASDILAAVNAAIAESTACGTALVGDISNTLGTFEALARGPLAGIVFYELIRFKSADAADVVGDAITRLSALPQTDTCRAGLAAHAPYSVAPELLRAVRAALAGPCSIHLAESSEEVEFVRTGGGAWRAQLEELGAWDPAWIPPGCSPVEYVDRHGFLDAATLAVHGVQMTARDLDIVSSRGSTIVTCPRSNRHTGVGDPPIEAFYASGVSVAVGTDSLASAPDLNVFAELAAMRALAPAVPAARLLDSATRQGARALGFEADFGTITPGKRARLLAVTLPRGTEDVEEYLVGGIEPAQIRWLESE